MKPFNSVLSVLIVSIISIFLVSCGDDNVSSVNNSNNSNDSLIYTYDSISIYGSSNQTLFFDNSIDSLFANDSIKVTFVLESNCGLVDSAIAALFLGNYSGFAFSVANYQDLNRTHNFYHRVTSSVNRISYTLSFNSTLYRYLKMYNIKIYRVY